jgi:hypothetical protein
MKNVKMQCVELHDDSENPIHCPFCGVKIAAGADEDGRSEWIVGTVNTAHDERSERFDNAVNAATSDKTDEEREELEDDVYELIGLVEIPNALVFHSVMGHPAEGTASVAFAPIEA